MSGFRNDSFPSILGGGIPGVQHSMIQGMDSGQERSITRNILRKAFGNNILIDGKTPINKNNPITPFRAAFSAGDMIGTINESQRSDLPKVNQISGLNKPRISKKNGGGVKTNGTAAYSGNPRYVYDGSDYIKYKKLKAKNKNYNDLSYGGSNNGSYSFLMSVRR